jgi:hypothetical protein
MLSRDGVWLYAGFGMVIGFIELFDKVVGYILQFTITHPIVQSRLHCRYLVTTSNSGRPVLFWVAELSPTSVTSF